MIKITVAIEQWEDGAIRVRLFEGGRILAGRGASLADPVGVSSVYDTMQICASACEAVRKKVAAGDRCVRSGGAGGKKLALIEIYPSNDRAAFCSFRAYQGGDPEIDRGRVLLPFPGLSQHATEIEKDVLLLGLLSRMIGPIQVAINKDLMRLAPAPIESPAV